MFHIDIDQHDELRLLQRHHADALFAIVDRYRESLRTWLPWVDGLASVDDARALIISALQRLAEGGGPTAGIWSRGELVGVIGFNDVEHGPRSATLGYWLIPSAEGRGLVTRALRAFVTLAFCELDLEKVELNIGTQNARSAAVARRLGFVHEGTRRHAEQLHDRVVDHDLYGLLRHEFQAASAARPDAAEDSNS